MRRLKIKKCAECGVDFIPTGSCCKVCPTCREDATKRYQAGYRATHRMPGVGKGGANIKGESHPQFSSGMSNFHRLRRELKASLNACEKCGKDLSTATRYEWCVHHKDRDRTHNVRENLQLLCKRCHQLAHDCIANLSK